MANSRVNRFRDLPSTAARKEAEFEMEFNEVIHKRQSVRAYQSQPVELEKLQSILEAVDRAPSAGNMQAYEVYLVTRPEKLGALAEAAHGQTFVEQAPVTLVFCSNPARDEEKYGSRGVELYSLQDATIACAFATLAVTDNGLASVWVGSFDEEAVLEVLGHPEGVRPVAILPIGYAAERPRQTARRRIRDLVHRL